MNSADRIMESLISQALKHSSPILILKSMGQTMEFPWQILQSYELPTLALQPKTIVITRS